MHRHTEPRDRVRLACLGRVPPLRARNLRGQGDPGGYQQRGDIEHRQRTGNDPAAHKGLGRMTLTTGPTDPYPLRVSRATAPAAFRGGG